MTSYFLRYCYILFPIILLENFALIFWAFQFFVVVVDYFSVFMCDIIVYKKKYIFGPHPIPDTELLIS